MVHPTLIARVLVRVAKWFPINHVCTLERGKEYPFFRCGACNRGDLGPSPEVGETCNTCGALVSEVLRIPDIEAIRAIELFERRKAEYGVTYGPR